MSKLLGLVAALAMAAPAICSAQSVERQPDQRMSDGSQQGSAQFTPTGTSVVIQRGANRKLSANVNTIDPVSTMQCVSATGCTIAVASTITLGVPNHDFNACSLVDGKEIGPNCDVLYSNYEAYPEIGNFMQSVLEVSPGPHTVQTQVKFFNVYEQLPIMLARWQIVYTMYDH